MVRFSGKFHLFFFSLTLLLFAAGCSEKKTETSPLLIRINEKSVSLEQFQKEFRRVFLLWEKLPAEQKTVMEKVVIAELIDRRLALDEAERLGISISEETVENSYRNFWSEYPSEKRKTLMAERGVSDSQWKEEEKQRLLLKKVAEKAVYSSLKVTEEEIETYYRDNFADFKGAEEVRARQILVASEEKAQQVLGLLRQGKPFEETAREYSLSPDGRQGGDLGFFPRGQMPEEFDAVVFSLTPGRLSNIVQSPYGFHIFLVEEHRKPTQLSLEKIRPRIQSILLERKKETAYNNWLVRLRKKAFIEIDWSLLKKSKKENHQHQN
jgi:parvulin-like peptidyl-prolyl isomerase